jgi:hypothetical protein
VNAEIKVIIKYEHAVRSLEQQHSIDATASELAQQGEVFPGGETRADTRNYRSQAGKP